MDYISGSKAPEKERQSAKPWAAVDGIAGSGEAREAWPWGNREPEGQWQQEPAGEADAQAVTGVSVWGRGGLNIPGSKPILTNPAIRV